MHTVQRVVRADTEEAVALAREGWTVVARSWAAQLDASTCDENRLRELLRPAEAVGTVRALTPADVASILELDAATISDYPGGKATRRAPLTPATATVGESRRAHGVVEPDGTLVAVTFVDIADAGAEIDFTAVTRTRRRMGLATAVKAASVLDMLAHGVRQVRTGGADENVAILAANRAIGFVIDEHWLTLAPSMSDPGART